MVSYQRAAFAYRRTVFGPAQVRSGCPAWVDCASSSWTRACAAVFAPPVDGFTSCDRRAPGLIVSSDIPVGPRRLLPAPRLCRTQRHRFGIPSSIPSNPSESRNDASARLTSNFAVCSRPRQGRAGDLVEPQFRVLEKERYAVSRSTPPLQSNAEVSLGKGPQDRCQNPSLMCAAR